MQYSCHMLRLLVIILDQTGQTATFAASMHRDFLRRYSNFMPGTSHAYAHRQQCCSGQIATPEIVTKSCVIMFDWSQMQHVRTLCNILYNHLSNHRKIFVQHYCTMLRQNVVTV